jgi:hypothetical protein
MPDRQAPQGKAATYRAGKELCFVLLEPISHMKINFNETYLYSLKKMAEGEQ